MQASSKFDCSTSVISQLTCYLVYSNGRYLKVNYHWNITGEADPIYVHRIIRRAMIRHFTFTFS